MNKEKIKNHLINYNNIIKETDDIYRNAAKKLGLAECVFWILYSLHTENHAPTQSEICSWMYQPKQTVNSALKKMTEEGLTEFFHASDHRKKQIRLTEKGKELAEKTVTKIFEAELSALSELSENEQENFIKLFRKYTDILKNKISAL